MIKQLAQIAMLIGPTITMAQNSTFNYPTAPSDNTVDDYFGVKIHDKYRPLENDTAAATLAWVVEENKLTRSYLDAIPFRRALVDRLTHLNNYAKTGMPSKESDGRYYFYKNDGLQNQSVLYRSATADGKDAEVFIDPNKLSADGTVALTGVFMSQDGKYTAYTVSRSGSDWTEIYVLDTATGKLLDDHIEWAKFTGAAWSGDGFYYSAYSKPEGSTYSVANEYHKVYYHKLGTPQSDDVVIYENVNEPLHFHNVGITDSRDALYVMGGGQGNGNSLFIKDLRNPSAEWITVEPSQDNDVQVIGSADGNLYILTSADAPNNRLVVAPVAAPQRANWVELIPEKKDAVLVDASFAGDKLIVTYNKDASHHAAVYNKKGEKLNDIVNFHLLPVIRREAAGQLIVGLDAINLFESGLAAHCRETVAVLAPREQRVRRIMLRDGISEDYARLRIGAQQPEEYYESRCGRLLYNRAESAGEFEAQARVFFRNLIWEVFDHE